MATIAQIAAELGLSKSTVSRALRGLPGISAQTAMKVQAAAMRLGYVRSAAAAGLSTGRQHAVGVVVPALNRWFYSGVLSGIDRQLADLGYDVVLFDLDRNGEAGARLFARAMLRRRVDALIVVAAAFAPEELAEFALLEIPMIAVGPPVAGMRSIGVDDAAIMTAATTHALELGHRALGLLGGYDVESRSVYSASAREHAFMRAALTAGARVEPAWMISGGYRSSAAMAATHELFQRPSHPTVLVCASDEMAFGALFALQRLGRDVPREISVVSIDGHEYAEAYGLTTCEQDPREQGAQAARIVVAEIEGAPAAAQPPPSAFTLTVRRSSAPPAR